MKKIHKKIAHIQATRFDKLLKNVESIKKGRKMRIHKYGVDRAAWYYFSRKDRTEIKKHNGDHYIPTQLKTAVVGYSNHKKASLLRLVVKAEGSVFINQRQRVGRQWRLWGNTYTVKDIICRNVFPHLVPLTEEEHKGLYGGYSEVDFV